MRRLGGWEEEEEEEERDCREAEMPKKIDIVADRDRC